MIIVKFKKEFFNYFPSNLLLCYKYCHFLSNSKNSCTDNWTSKCIRVSTIGDKQKITRNRYVFFLFYDPVSLKSLLQNKDVFTVDTVIGIFGHNLFNND